MYFLYSSRVVAPMQWSSPLASFGFRRFPASIDPSVFPAPTIVWISSIKSMILPSDLSISFRTALRRSSNSPLYLAPAISEPISREKMVFPLSPSGTSPFTIRWASPSTTAVFPTPGCPISTGLFFVLLDRISIALLISRSVPITGSSLPLLAASTKSVPYLFRASYVSSGFWLVTLWFPLTIVRAFMNSSLLIPYLVINLPTSWLLESRIARYRCSTLTYSSLKSLAIFSALVSTLLSSELIYNCAELPLTLGSFSRSDFKSAFKELTSTFIASKSLGIKPSLSLIIA